MKSSTKNKFQISSVYVGTVLGAGFASGQEMLKFFASYGYNGILGILFTGLLFALIGWAVLEIVYVHQINNYREFIYPMMGEFLGNIMEWVVSLFMFICFCAMLAGSGALLHQRFDVPFQYGVLFMAILCIGTFIFDVKGVILINTILAPLLIVGSLLLGIYILVFRDISVFSNEVLQAVHLITDNWITSSIIYVSYNTITSVVVLTSMLSLLDSKKTARIGAFTAGGALGVIGLFLGLATLINYGDIQGLEIPMLAIVMHYMPIIQYIYIFVLLSAMFTTAIANGYGFITRMSSLLHMSRKMFIIIFVSIAIVFSQFGFSNMVGKIYPFFGYLGIFEIVLIFLYFIVVNLKRTKHTEKRFSEKLGSFRSKHF